MKSSMMGDFKGKRRKVQAGLVIVLAILFFGIPTQAKAACVNPAGTAGAVVYNSDIKVFQYCNDTNWIRMTKPGGGAGGCTNPALAEGKLVYNEDSRVLQGCAGNAHRTAGPIGGANNWASISAGLLHTCGIFAKSGKLMCWGSSANGRLGDNNLSIDRATPVSISGGGIWKQVSAGAHTCAIKSDDTLWCWGPNSSGQVGDNTTILSRMLPTTVSGGGAWKQVSTGEFHTCAIKSNDTLWCWGSNANGRTGLNTTAGTTLVPTGISGGGTWKYISAGNAHTCGIKSDDTLWCWGLNTNGRLGDNSQTQRQIPTAVNGGGSWKNVSTGAAHTCGIKSNDTLWCWGLNTGGQLGDNSTTQRLIPTAINGGGSWKQVAAGSVHTCGIKSDDTIFCWGTNADGQLGDTTTDARLVPTALSGGGTWSSVDTYGKHVCATSLGAKVISCWGQGSEGQRGDNVTELNSASPALVSGGDKWLSISAGSMGWGNTFTCGVKSSDGSVWCWGYNDYGVLGSAIPLGARTFTKFKVSGAHVFTSVTSGAYHACGLKADGSAWCWGGNDEGMLGDASNIDKTAPAAVSGGHVFTKLVADAYSTCGIKTDGTAMCWGANWDYQIGDGGTASSNTPVAVSGGYQWKEIDPGTTGTCGIRTDGVAMCWGTYAVGNGTWSSSTPAIVSGGHTWKSISYGEYHACGVRTDDVAMCWGSDWSSELANGAGSDSNIPALVVGGHLFKSISAGAYTTCGIRTDDTAVCWGENQYGQTGTGTLQNDLSVPTEIVGKAVWKTIGASYSHTCGLSKLNDAYCWGYYFWGALGDGKIGASTSAAAAMCGEPFGNAGKIVYNADFNVMQYCDGAGWVEMRQ